MSAFAATSLTGKRRLTRMLVLVLATLLAVAPGTALFAQIDDLSKPADMEQLVTRMRPFVSVA